MFLVPISNCYSFNYTLDETYTSGVASFGIPSEWKKVDKSNTVFFYKPNSDNKSISYIGYITSPFNEVQVIQTGADNSVMSNSTFFESIEAGSITDDDTLISSNYQTIDGYECMKLEKTTSTDDYGELHSISYLWYENATLYGLVAYTNEDEEKFWDLFDEVKQSFKMNSASVSLKSDLLPINEEYEVDVNQKNSDSNDKITIKVADGTVATVQNNKIKGLKEGETTIIATSESGLYAIKDVSFYVPTESIVLDKTELALSLNQEETLTATVVPDNASYEWKTSAPSVVSNDNGKLVAKGYGNAAVSVETFDGKEAVCNVTVTETVPDFNTMNSEEAKEWGEKYGVTVTTTTEYSDEVSEGSVISQSMEAGENIISNSPTIKIVYSLGRKPTTGELNALYKAETYSDYLYMSKAAIYDQLVSEYGEGFSASEAQYAIDHMEADWNDNALHKAKVYYEDMHMSKDAVYNQLVSSYGEKFTAKQAQYAIEHLDD